MKKRKTKRLDSISIKWSKFHDGLAYKATDNLYEAGKIYDRFMGGYSKPGLFSDWGQDVPSLVKELERLGYDITTLRFSVKKKNK
jgi:hypothetical protein